MAQPDDSKTAAGPVHDDGLSDDLRVALDAAEEAGRVIRDHLSSRADVTIKSPDQPVTAADLAANRVLHDRLVGERPGYGWLSEETADSADRLACERVWIVDPIDGTNSFVDGYAEYVVSIGLTVDGEVRLGVVLNPATGERYHAVHGGGAFLNGEPLCLTQSRGGAPTLLASRSELGRGEFDTLPEEWRIRPLGSTAYKMVKVADATGAGYLSRGPKSEWDVCAAALIVAEAGGTVTDLRGRTLRFNRADPYVHGMVAAHSDLHPILLRHAVALAGPARGRNKDEP
jgi:myo-inositol-1(or 4)-monophosphatase